MSDMEETVEVILDDAPKVDTKKVDEQEVEIVEAPKKGKDVDSALKELNARLEQERLAREQAEERARVSDQKAQMAYGEVSDTNMHLVASAIDSVKRDQEILKSHLRDSMAIGDFDKAADIQSAMQVNFNKLSQLETGYEEMRNTPRQPVAPQPREMNVDTLINQVTPRSAEWLRTNREHLPDPRSIRVMARAHEDAVDYGIVPESDAYFRFVENRLGIGESKRAVPGFDDAMEYAAKPTQKRSSPPSAPVSRSGNSTNRSGVVTLTASEVEAAKISGITPQEYYRNKMKGDTRH